MDVLLISNISWENPISMDNDKLIKFKKFQKFDISLFNKFHHNMGSYGIMFCNPEKLKGEERGSICPVPIIYFVDRE